MKRFLTLVLAVILVMSLSVTALGTGYTGEVEPINVILINADTGEVLYSKNEKAAAYTADLTKLMTAYVTAKCIPDLGSVVTVSPYAFYNISGGTKVGISEGEEITVRDLLAGMILGNGDDCAQALAIYIGGSVSGFVDLMNSYAKDLGMKGTTFATPTGVHSSYQVSTAADMGKLACALLEYPELMEIFSSVSYTLPKTNESDERTIYNTNRLLCEYAGEVSYLYEGATGMISGYNNNAAACLAASAEKYGVKLVCIILGDISGSRTVRWKLAADLFDYAFEQYLPVPAENVLANIPAIYTDASGEMTEVKVDFTGVTVKHDTLSEGITATVISEDGITGTVVYTDLQGDVVAEIPVTIKETEPEVPDEPEIPDQPEEPEEIPEVSGEPETPEEPVTETPEEIPAEELEEGKKGFSFRTALAILLSVIVAVSCLWGAVTTVKKKSRGRHASENDSFKVKFRQYFMTYALFVVIAVILILIICAVII